MKKVLIIEDEEVLAGMYGDKFKNEGFEVLLCGEGEKGLKLALEKTPDVLILDILLPDTEGTEVLKKIRESGKWGKNLPIIMLTNLDPEDYILDAIEKYRPSYYFTKTSIEPSEVVNKAKELLGV